MTTTEEQLHEEETVTLAAESTGSVAALWKSLRASGFKQEEDVFVVPRREKSIPPWQHDVYVEVEILRNGEEVFEPDEVWDTLNLLYPLARVPETGIAIFVEKAAALAASLGLPLRYGGSVVSPEHLQNGLVAAAAELRRTLGEPGSEEVALHIEKSYPRR